MSMGTGAKARFDAIREVNSRTPRKFDPPRDESGKTTASFGFLRINTFDLPKMKEKLPKEVYTENRSTIEHGKEARRGYREHRRQCDQGMGTCPRRDSLLSLVSTSDRKHR